MIPRLKPYLRWQEVLTIFKSQKNSVALFEKAFAEQFKTRHAIAFPYGRSALWAFLKAHDISNAEIIQPAYTCSVVAHATVLSGNKPVFVDCNLSDYNMDLTKLAAAITAETRAVIPTHIFGNPMDVNAVNAIVAKAEKKFGHKIMVIQDCAHSFGASFQERSVINAGDCAIFGLGISKLITSIFGGMFTTDDDDIANNIRVFRDREFHKVGLIKTARRYLYLLAIYPAFANIFYGLVYWLQEKTPFLNQLTKAYHLDEKIHFPPDYIDLMTNIEAAVGIEQLKKYPTIISRRRETANAYFVHDPNDPQFIFPPHTKGATYSHFAIRTDLRDQTMAYFAAHGIQLGYLIEYSMPHHPAYKVYAKGQTFPNALKCSQSMINLPIHPDLKTKHIKNIISSLENTLADEK